MTGCIALVVAAGRGQRFGGAMPKQYRELGGMSLVRRALLAFVAHPAVKTVRAVIHPDDRALFDASSAGLDLLEPVAGGASRQESARLGLESLEAKAPQWVLIHDAARPFVEQALISRTLAALDTAPGAVPAVAVRDTLKREAEGRVAETVSREGLWRAQTPQGFCYLEILEAHRRFSGLELTDDAAVAEKAGLGVALVEGDEDNVKVTTEEDLRRAEALLGAGEVRTGMGFDVHRLGPGDGLMLCGVSIPFESGLEGHSDADVGLHALTDAILGAIGAGDIGSHFPPGDAEWRDAPSETFLRHAGALLTALGGTVANLDLTLICEQPRVALHRAAMTGRIAEILGIDRGRVSVKGTTTERLGFLGRGEGIAAQAVATVRLPVGKVGD